MINGWDEVTINTWRELNNIQSEHEITMLIERLSIIMDKDSEDIRKMKPNEFNQLINTIGWLNDELPSEPTIRFELNGKRYGMIPDLSLISTGEFVDAEMWKNDTIQNMHLLSALIYRPIVNEEEDTYEIEEHTNKGFMRRAELFNDQLPITMVYGAVIFFSSFGILFTEIMTEYLQQNIQ